MNFFALCSFNNPAHRQRALASFHGAAQAPSVTNSARARVCVCVCMRVCARARARACGVCVCVCVCVCVVQALQLQQQHKCAQHSLLVCVMPTVVLTHKHVYALREARTLLVWLVIV